MKKLILLIGIIVLWASGPVSAQIGIGTTVPDGSAMLDISSTTKGLLAPRMTTGQRTAISNPADGLLVYDLTTHSYWVYQTPVWEEISKGGTLWGRTGTSTWLYNTNDRVGIGTTLPVAKLDVPGSFIFSGGSGDINKDGLVDNVDATIAYNFAVGAVIPTREERALGDVNADLKNDLTDAVIILSMFLGNGTLEEHLRNSRFMTGISNFGDMSVVGDETFQINGYVNLEPVTSAPSPTTDHLYNLGGSLYFNGINLTTSQTLAGIYANAGNTVHTTAAGGNIRFYNDYPWNPEALFIKYNDGMIGMGTTAPTAKLDIRHAGMELDFVTGLNVDVFGGEFADGIVSNNHAGGAGADGWAGKFYSAAQWGGTLYAQYSGPDDVGVPFRVDDESGDVTPFVIDCKGNTGIGTSHFGDDAVNVLGLGNATPPSTSPSDMIQVYSQYFDGGYFPARSTLLVRDDLGEVMALGPLTDRWLGNASNTFFGIGVAGAGTMTHGGSGEGENNTAFGSGTLHNLTWGWDNTAVGISALRAVTGGRYNTGIGSTALYNNTLGTNNTALGSGALFSVNTGSFNTAVGTDALNTVTTGTYNTAIGNDADVSSNGLTNATAIGNGAIADASNQVRLGNPSVTSLFCFGATNATSASAPNMVVNTSGQIMRSTATVATGSGTTGRVALWTTASSLGSDDNFYWDNTGKRLGIGTTSPVARLQVEVPGPTGTAQTVKMGSKFLSIGSWYGAGGMGIYTNDGVVEIGDGAAVNGVLKMINGGGGTGIMLNSSGDSYFEDSQRLGFGTSAPDAIVEIKPNAAFDRQALKINQQATNQPFIDYTGTFDNINPPTSGDFNGNLTNYNNAGGTVVGPKYGAGMGWTFVGMVKVEINGSTYWMPYYQPEGPECPRVDAWINGQWVMVGRAVQHLHGKSLDGRHDIILNTPAQRFRLVEDELETSYIHRITGDGEDWGLGEQVTRTAPAFGVDGPAIEFRFSKPVTRLETYGYYEYLPADGNGK